MSMVVALCIMARKAFNCFSFGVCVVLEGDMFSSGLEKEALRLRVEPGNWISRDFAEDIEVLEFYLAPTNVALTLFCEKVPPVGFLFLRN
jgi:hypothetical protein